MDAVTRQFAALAEQDGKLWVRFKNSDGEANEREMSYRQYRVWLAQAHSNGFTLLEVETVRKPS